MGAVSFSVRAELRGRWRSFFAIAAIAGLAGGLVIAAAAGARRTDSAFSRFLDAAPGPDAIVPNIPDPTARSAIFPAGLVRGLPEVDALFETKPMVLIVNGQDSYAVAHPDVSLDSRFRYKLLAGRVPDPTKEDEAIVSYLAAQRLGIHVGDRVPFQLIPPVAARYKQLGVRLPATFRVVGIEIVPLELPTSSPTGVDFHMTPALYRLLPGPPPPGSLVIALRRGPAGVSAFRTHLESLAAGKPVLVIETHLTDDASRRALHLQALALWVLAASAAAAVTLILAQTFGREIFLEAEDNSVLRSLGMSGRQLWVKAMTRSAMKGLAAAVVAVGVAFALSPLLPVGLGRLAEPHPGFAFDATAIGLGALGLIALVFMLSAVPAARAARVRPPRDEKFAHRGGDWTGATARAGLPLTAVVGVRLALKQGSGRNAVPIRSTLATIALSLAAFAIAIDVGASLTRMLDTPRLYGLTWDAGLQGRTTDVRVHKEALIRHQDVASIAFGVTDVPFTIDGRAIDGELIDPPVNGSSGVVILEGRAPVRPMELALGTRTLRELGVRIGDVVTAGVSGTEPVRMRIVGRVILQPISSSLQLGDVVRSTKLRLGEGVLLSYSAGDQQAPGALPPAGVFIRFRPGADRERAMQDLRAIIGGDVVPTAFQRPNDVVNFGRVQNLPLVLAALLGLIGVAALTHMLVSSVRRRRGDLAIMKTLGYDRRQMRLSVIWQASTLVLIALAAGLPVGIVGGRWAWGLFADQLGIDRSPTIATTTLLFTIPATLLLANAIAAFPGRAAARIRPAVALRAE
jgi:hypothetical protein